MSKEAINDYRELWKLAMDELVDKVYSNLRSNKELQEIFSFQPKFRKYLMSDKIAKKQDYFKQHVKILNILIGNE